MPQVVNIEINDQVMRSYGDTNIKFSDSIDGSLYVFFPLKFITLVLFYWFLGRVLLKIIYVKI